MNHRMWETHILSAGAGWEKENKPRWNWNFKPQEGATEGQLENISLRTEKMSPGSGAMGRLGERPLLLPLSSPVPKNLFSGPQSNTKAMAKTTLKPSRLQEPWVLSSFWLLLTLVPPVMPNEDLTHHPTPSLEGALHEDSLIPPSITLWSGHAHLPCLTEKELNLWASRHVGPTPTSSSRHQCRLLEAASAPLHTDHTEGKTWGWKDPFGLWTQGCPKAKSSNTITVLKWTCWWWLLMVSETMGPASWRKQSVSWDLLPQTPAAPWGRRDSQPKQTR